MNRESITKTIQYGYFSIAFSMGFVLLFLNCQFFMSFLFPSLAMNTAQWQLALIHFMLWSSLALFLNTLTFSPVFTLKIFKVTRVLSILIFLSMILVFLIVPKY